jgi:hypothetical protein
MEIIKRTSETEKQTVSTRGYNEKMQVSLNNYGHIVLRFFTHHSNYDIDKCKYCDLPIYYENEKWYHRIADRAPNEYCAMMSDNPLLDGKMSDLQRAEPRAYVSPEETLIVLDQSESRDLIRFIKERLQ